MEEEAQDQSREPEDAAVPPRRFTRWFYIMATVAALLACLALVGWFAVVPRIVEQRLVDAFRELGFREVSLRVGSVGFKQAQILDLRLGGNQPIVIARIRADYQLGDALGGEVDSLEVEGLELGAILNAAGVRFPQLERLRMPETEEPMRQLPFDKITVRGARLNLRLSDGESRVIPFAAELTREGARVVALAISAPQHAAALKAALEFGEEGTDLAEGRLEWECKEAVLPWLEEPLREVSLQLAFDGEVKEEGLALSILPGSRMAARMDRVSLRDGTEAQDVRLAGMMAGEPWVFKSISTSVHRGGFNGRLTAEGVRWGNGEMAVSGRALTMDVFADEAGLKMLFQPGTELEWRPAEGFLNARGMTADGFKAMLRNLSEPASLHLPVDGNWSVVVPGARLEARSGVLSLLDGNFTCGSVEGGFKVGAEIGKEGGHVRLRTGARLNTGAIRHWLFQHLNPAAIDPTEWQLAEHSDEPLLSWDGSGKVRFRGSLLAAAMTSRQGALQLDANPLELGIIAETGKVILKVVDRTRLELRPDLDWLAEHGFKAESLVVAAEDFGGPITLDRTDTGEVWTLEAPVVRLGVRAETVELSGAGLSLDSLNTKLLLKADFGGEGPILNLLEPAEVLTGKILYTDENRTTKITVGHWLLQPLANEPLLDLATREGGGLAMAFNGEVMGQDVNASTAKVSARVGRLSFKGSYSDEAGVGWNGALMLMEGMAVVEDAGVVLEKMEGKFPITAGRLDGNFTIGAAQWGPDTLPEFRGRLQVDGGDVQLRAEGDVIAGLKVTLFGDLREGLLQAELGAPPAVIKDAWALGRRFGKLGDLEITGAVGFHALFGHDPASLTRLRTHLHFEDVTMASVELGVIAEGISGTVALHGLPGQMTTKVSQKVTVRRARLGALDLVNGVLEFRVDEAGVLIDAESWSLARDPEGRFRAAGVRLAKGKPLEALIHVEKLDLGIWLDWLTDGNVVASGKLSGRMPVTLMGKESRLPVRVGDGAVLKTEGPGKLQFKSAQWAGDWLESVDPRFKTDPLLMQLRQGVVEALQDFTYSSIEFSYDAKADRMRVAVSGEGKTKQGRVVKFEPTINIQPVASWVNESYNELVLLAHVENLVNRDLDDLFGD